jgi:hypothetical protein
MAEIPHCTKQEAFVGLRHGNFARFKSSFWKWPGFFFAGVGEITTRERTGDVELARYDGKPPTIFRIFKNEPFKRT